MTLKRTAMDSQHERGIALVLALFLMTALSVLAASLMFLAQTETYASMNYRMMSQARYAGESAVQKAANFLLDTGQYLPPSAAGADPLSNYNRFVSPVTLVSNGLPVVLTANSGCTGSNYPVAAVATAFCNAAKGTLTAGNTAMSYNASATLIAMQAFTSYGGGPSVVQTWQVTGDGTLSGARNATVEVAATIETPKVSASSYAAFATSNSCGALTFQGNVRTDSYDSTGTTGGTAPTTTASGGDVGTNGNLAVGGQATVQGNLYSPRTGVGTCTTGNVTALTQTGAASVAGSVIQLPNAVTYPPPTVPAPSPLPAVSLSSAGTAVTTCALLGLTVGTQCNVDSTTNTITINGNGATLTLPSISLSASVNLVLVAAGPISAQYNFNSIQLTGQSSIAVSATSPTQSVLVNLSGVDNTGTAIATPLDLSGGTFAAVTGCATCSAFDASMLQFVYGGSGTITLRGNSGAAATFYAPNATATFVGTSDLYGSILARSINETGSGNIHYDRRLSHGFYVAGNPVVGTFTWKRY